MAIKKKYPNAKIHAVHGSETMDGYHHVRYTTTGNLNRSATKRFRKWGLARKFANAKAEEWGIKATIS